MVGFGRFLEGCACLDQRADSVPHPRTELGCQRWGPMRSGVRAEIYEEALRPFRQPLLDAGRRVGDRLHGGLGAAAHTRRQHGRERVECRRPIVVGEPTPQFDARRRQERLLIHQRSDGARVVHVRCFAQAGDDTVERAGAEGHTDEVPDPYAHLRRDGVGERAAGLVGARVYHHICEPGLNGLLMWSGVRCGVRRWGHVPYLGAGLLTALSA